MIAGLFFALTLAGGVPSPPPNLLVIACKTHTYEAKSRFNGRVGAT